MAKGFSFTFDKEDVNGERVNTKITCVETQEVFKMEWEVVDKVEYNAKSNTFTL